MHESSKSIGQSIVLPQLCVYEQHTQQLQLAQLSLILSIFAFILSLSRPPLALYFLVVKRPKTDAPSFKDDDLDRRFAFSINCLPLGLGSSVARAGVSGFVVARKSDIRFALRKSVE